MSSAPPTTPTDELFPVWTDLVDNWRAVDAHWIRDRVVQIFDDAAERTAVLGASARQGMVSYLKGTDSLEFRKASAWESVRYPNLTVTSDATTVTLRRTGAGAGLTLKADGSTEITTLLAGTTAAGSTLDATGISIKIGARTVKLATDATQLTVDSPVKVTGDLESTAALKGASLNIAGNLVAVNATLSGALTAASAAVTGTLTAGLVNVTDAELAMVTSLAVFRNKLSAANRLSFSSTGAAILTGATVAVNGALTVANAATLQGATEFQGATTLHPAGTTAAPVAGVVALNRAPTTGDTQPDGTIWVQI